ncbi:MAG: hypothetical protein ACJ72N_01485 [Labedaea sp.]
MQLLKGKPAMTGVLAALLSLAVLIPAGPAMASQDRAAAAAVPPCEPGGYPGVPGTRVKSPDSPKVYLVDPTGSRRWIINGDGYFALFRNWNGIQTIANLECMWEGRDLKTFSNPENPGNLDRGSFLATDNQSARVYLIDGVEARWIAPGGFEKYQFDWSKIANFNSEEMWRTYVSGPPWN